MKDGQKQPTDDQVKVMMSDWFSGLGRGDNFIHKNTNGAMEHRMEHEHYSGYLIGDVDNMPTEEFIKRSRRIAERIANMMTDEKITVSVGQSSQSWSQPGKIQLATDYFDDPSLTPGQKTDILAGLAVHEAAHLRHTDFSVISECCTKGDHLDALRKNLINIIEDERIEWLTGEEMPGMADYLGCTKNYFFGKLQENSCGKKEEETRLSKVLNSFLDAVRYPSNLTKENVIDNWEEMEGLRKAMNPFPKSCEQLPGTVEKVIDVLKDLVKKDLQEQKKNTSQNSQNGTGNNTASQSGESGNQSGASGNQPRESGSQPQDGDGKDKTDGKKKQTISDSDVIKEIENQMRTVSGAEAMQKLAEASKPNDPAKQATCMSNMNKSDYANDEVEREEIGGNGAGSGKSVYLKKVKGSQYPYQQSIRKIKKYVPAMTKALTCRSLDTDYELKGMPTGKLNTNKFAVLKSGNENIFVKKGSVITNAASLCLLIDESGSMRGNKMLNARYAAVLIEQSLKHIQKLHFYAYGFGGSSLNIYSEDGKSTKYALGSTAADGGTPTAEAMLASAKRIRRRFSGKCLMIVLTDGVPNDINATREADRNLRKSGFYTIGVGIGEASTDISQIMEESIIMTDITGLPLQIGKITKKYLSKLIIKQES